jgi:serine/threonine protein kinase
LAEEEGVTLEQDKLLGHMLVSSGLLKRDQLDEVLEAIRKSPGLNLREELVRRGWVTREVLDRAFEASINVTARTAVSPPTASTVGVGAPPPTAPTQADGAPTAGTLPKSQTASTIGLTPDEAAAVEDPSRLPPEVARAAENPKNRFGKYILLRPLGQGGMAVVYKAWDTFLSQFVALKFIKSQEFSDGEDKVKQGQFEAFMSEARLAVRLNHPNIARVYELGKNEDKFYMAQYFIDGPTLHEVIHGTRNRSLETQFYGDPQRYVKIMRDLAKAMAYAHSLTPPIIHRDLKPSNVLLDSTGHAYVVDFGLAKELKVDGGSMSGSVKGTPKYMAPEQAEGRSRDMDGRTDIWALGVILYEMLTGRAPFEDENIHRLLSRIVNDEPPWPRHVVASQTAKISPSSQGALAIPRELETIAMKCLQKDKRHRYATAQELVDDLERALKGERISVPDHSFYWAMGRLGRWIRRHRLALLFLVLGLGAAGAAVTTGWIRPRLALRELVARGDQLARDHRLEELAPIEEAIARIDPLHPKLAEYRRLREDLGKISLARLAEVVAIRDAFLNRPSAESLSALATMLAGVEPVLAATARQGLREWWVGFTSSREVEASALYGTGKPSREWLSEEVRKRALQIQKDLELAQRVLAQAPTLGIPPVDLGRAEESLRAILSWRGSFTLVANIHPWAQVRVRVGPKDLSRESSQQEDMTPLRYEGLPVGALRLEFSGGPGARVVEVPESALRDGAVLRVWGTFDRIEQAID